MNYSNEKTLSLIVILSIFILLSLCVSSPGTRGSTTKKSAKETVVRFFNTLSRGSNVNQLHWGTVGSGKDGYRKAYKFLSQQFRKRTSFEEFYTSYEGTATVELIQIHQCSNSEDDKSSDIEFFVEIRAIEEIHNGELKSGIVWYAGWVSVLTRDGGWKIDSIELNPENLISYQVGGHKPWLSSPVMVAAAHPSTKLERIGISSDADYGNYAKVKKLSDNVSKVTFRNFKKEVSVRVVKLYSGGWVVI